MTGTSLSQYRILEELGRGGMGIVYKAEDTKLERQVALKVLPAAALASEDDRARFYREAKAAAALNHPNIAAIHQIDEAIAVDADGNQIEASDGPRPFIAMEYIEGGTLEDRIKAGPLKLDEAVRIATQVADALKAAHAKDIVHRDIKSANIMLTTDGQAKVLDFGLAQTNHSTKLTRMGSTLGTVAYMSPEQARGEDVDGRTDLYSLGTVLYEMIAGRLPFGGEYEQAVVYSILNAEPEPLTSVRTGVPMQLEWTVDKLLAKDADVRYQTAADLLADLKALDLSGSGHSRRSMPAMNPVSHSASRQLKSKGAHPWRLIAGLMSLFVVVLAGVLLWPRSESESLQSATIRSEIRIENYGTLQNLALSRDGGLLAVVFREGKILVRDMATGETTLIDSPGANTVDFSASGEEILVSGLRNLIRMDANGSNAVTLATTETWNWARFGPNDEVLYSTYDSFVVRIPRIGRQDTLRIEGTGRLYPYSRTPDGSVVILEVDGLEVPVASFLWHPDKNEVTRLDHLSFFVLESGHGFSYASRENLSVIPLNHDWKQAGEERPLPFNVDLGFAVSSTGVVVSEGAGAKNQPTRRLLVRNVSGDERVIVEEMSTPYFALSTDETRVAYSVPVSSGDSPVQIRDVRSGLDSPVAAGQSLEQFSWAPDDATLWGFQRGVLVATPTDQSRAPEEKLDVIETVASISWMPGGASFLIPRWIPGENLTIELHQFDVDSGSITELVTGQSFLAGATVSPDGKHIGYYAPKERPLEDTPYTIQELDSGRTFELRGDQFFGTIRWALDRSGIEYRSGDSLMVVPIDLSDGFRMTGEPEVVAVIPGLDTWQRTSTGEIYFSQPMDENGVRFSPEESEITLNVIVNWFAELERIAPTKIQ